MEWRPDGEVNPRTSSLGLRRPPGHSQAVRCLLPEWPDMSGGSLGASLSPRWLDDEISREGRLPAFGPALILMRAFTGPLALE